MRLGRFRFFRSDVGQDVRAWPMLALLLIVVAVAIGCVLWFMREAMRNERLAVRQKLAEAYRGQLALLQTRGEEQWRRELERFDRDEPGPALFAAAVREHWADSIICLAENGNAVYPQSTSASRDAEANADLLALEKLSDHSDPQFKATAERLFQRVTDYQSNRMPASQRRFLMRELLKLQPGVAFPTLAAEDLAARYLENHGVSEIPTVLQESRAADAWACASPGRRVIALFTTGTVRSKLELSAAAGTARDVRLTALAPHEETQTDVTLGAVSLAPQMPGWRLALSPNDRGVFDSTAERRVTTYVWIGSAVVAGMTLLIFLIARGFTRQVHLARMKNDLVATVSHELKTPLTAMRALVDTLLDTEHFDERTTREYLHLISRENARLSRLIENFLTFSRLERNRMNFRFESMRPEQIVEGAINAMGERCHAPECRFESKTETNLPPIIADQNALTTALLNLLDNAWKYSGERKNITLRTSTCNGGVCFAVEDNGIGIPERESRRIFQRFYQVDQRLSRVGDGCGLGLSIVRSIVNAHHGTVSVNSEVGRGSTFTIEIPAQAAL